MVGLGAPVAAVPCLLPPVDVPIAEPYREPACPYCPGQRGVRYHPAPGTSVRAVAGGRVDFVGLVAGVRWVTVGHPDGLRSTYGYLRSARVKVGQQVAMGDLLGVSGALLHLGLRRGEQYLDPTPVLGRAVGRVRLVPVAGSGGRPVSPPGSRSPVRPRPAPRLVCPSVAVVGARSPR